MIKKSIDFVSENYPIIILVIIMIAMVIAGAGLITQAIHDNHSGADFMNDCIQRGGTWNVGRVGGADSYWCSFPPQGR